jgi:hypothetical protein
MKTIENTSQLRVLVVRSPRFVPQWVVMKEFAHMSRVRSYYANFRRSGGPRDKFLAVRPTCFEAVSGVDAISLMLIAPPPEFPIHPLLLSNWIFNDPDLGGCVLDCGLSPQRDCAISCLTNSLVVDLERV